MSSGPDETFERWDVAWQRALYGPEGFYRKGSGPSQHFRTSVHASALLAGALARLARSSGLRRVVDVGSGRGELLSALAAADPDLELVGLDVVARPAGLPDHVGWVVSPGGAELPSSDLFGRSLVVAHEWLDDVPCAVLEVADDGLPRVVEVTSSGAERLGPAPGADELDWTRRWWPLDGAEPGTRVEVGLARDRAWAALVRAAPGSLLLAVDYSHRRQDRPPGGTLVGYASGRVGPPAPDGSGDVTAHVALDAVAAAGEAAGATGTALTDQRSALRSFGVDATLPDAGTARQDPAGYLDAVARASEAAELLDRRGLGGFGWLLQSTGAGLPTGWEPGAGPVG